MPKMTMKKWLLFAPVVASALSYDVRFTGLENPRALNAVLDHSQLVSLQHRPPASINGLRYRINADIPTILKVLHAYAYYDASIDSSLETIDDNVRVNIAINPGIQFTLQSFVAKTSNCEELAEIEGCTPLTPEDVGAKIGSPALTQNILNAEMGVLRALSRCAHPLAEIEKRQVEVDMETQTVSADTCVSAGPFTTFGETNFFGIENIHPRFIRRRIAYIQGCPYNSELVTQTQEKLLNTELFSSVLISHGDELDECGSLPLKLSVAEASHKKIGLGAFYATINGFGGNFSWTHRNLRGMGELLSIRAEYAQKAYSGIITYKKPDFLSIDQSYRALFKVAHVNIRAYDSLTYRFANYVDRPVPTDGYVSFGVKVDHIRVTNSTTDGTYFLVGVPIFGKYERVENPINPKSGYTLTFSSTPYQSFDNSRVRFVKQRFTGTCYIPLFPNKRVILALLMQTGSIAGTKRKNVPMPKLFLGGSENELRGYRYNSVSPLRGTKPLGGRSAIFASTELRILLFEKIGIVPFADFGTVSNKELPSVDEKWLKSVGIGLRYFAFFGPLRLDIGFPLDKRKSIDSNYEIYASVGQSF